MHVLFLLSNTVCLCLSEKQKLQAFVDLYSVPNETVNSSTRVQSTSSSVAESQPASQEVPRSPLPDTTLPLQLSESQIESIIQNNSSNVLIQYLVKKLESQKQMLEAKTVEIGNCKAENASFVQQIQSTGASLQKQFETNQQSDSYLQQLIAKLLSELQIPDSSSFNLTDTGTDNLQQVVSTLVEQLFSKHHQLQTDQLELHQKYDQSGTVNSDLQQKIDNLTKEKLDLDTKFTNSEKLFNEKLLNSEKLLHEKLAIIQNLQTNKETNDAVVESAQLEISKLHQQLDFIQNNFSNSLNLSNELFISNEYTLNNQIVNLKQTIKELNEKLLEIKNLNSNFILQINELQIENSNLHNDARANKQYIDQKQNEISSLQTIVNELQHLNSTQSAEINELQKLNSNFKTELTNSSSQIKLLNSEKLRYFRQCVSQKLLNKFYQTKICKLSFKNKLFFNSLSKFIFELHSIKLEYINFYFEMLYLFANLIPSLFDKSLLEFANYHSKSILNTTNSNCNYEQLYNNLLIEKFDLLNTIISLQKQLKVFPYICLSSFCALDLI